MYPPQNLSAYASPILETPHQHRCPHRWSQSQRNPVLPAQQFKALLPSYSAQRPYAHIATPHTSHPQTYPQTRLPLLPSCPAFLMPGEEPSNSPKHAARALLSSRSHPEEDPSIPPATISQLNLSNDQPNQTDGGENNNSKRYERSNHF